MYKLLPAIWPTHFPDLDNQAHQSYDFFNQCHPSRRARMFHHKRYDGLILQFIGDRDTHRARRDLGHLVEAVITLAGVTPST
jgi:hypothetical protein